MTDLILVAYASRHGSTEEVAADIAATLRDEGYSVTFKPAKELQALSSYQAVVLGAPLYMYRWHKDARRFLSRHKKTLSERPTAVFALGPTRDPHDEAEWQSSREQLNKELENFPWLEPVSLKMFGGKFDPESLKFPMNKFAASEPPTDIRDWDRIRTWARELGTRLQVSPT